MHVYNLGIRFAAVVHEHADRTALWFSPTDTVTYAQLDARSNATARALLHAGVRRRDVVCISGEKVLGTYVAIIACLKIGATYCALDPDGPPERQRLIVDTCRPALVAGTSGYLGRAREAGLLEAIPAFEIQAAPGADEEPLPETGQVLGSDPAYIMFTSGSTGVPKGAVMSHDNVRNLIDWAQETYALDEHDVMTNLNPLYFDNSVFDLFACLFSGATLVPFSREEVRDPKTLVDKVAAAGCTVWFSVPTLLVFLQTMHATDGTNLRSIRRFIFGGEGYPKAKLVDLFRTYSDTSALYNVYGPTECTCICSSHRLSERDFGDLSGLPPLGAIAANFSCLIRDEDGAEVSAGEAGELCLLGPGVGLGYYNDPERTAERFIQDPRTDSYRELMYVTGDLVRENPVTGQLEILGRIDNQVKHLGYRIELEEIEAALNRLAYVAQAAAVHGTRRGLSRIVAVIATDRELDAGTIRADLAAIIPDYMIPSDFYFEPELPKNANGKIDRRALVAKYLPPDEARRS